MWNSNFSRGLAVYAALAVGGALPAQTGETVNDIAGQPAASPVEPGGSSVRIVRLSQARGGVEMDRGTGRGFEAAFANMPVVGGAVLRTSTEGVAEVEFEDNSTLRLTPGAEVRFLQLSRTAAGTTETTVAVVKGLVYVGLEKTKGNEFRLEDGKAQLSLEPGAHLRLDASKPEAELAVFEGQVGVKLGAAATTVAKHQTMQLNPATQTLSAVAHGTATADLDDWDKQSTDYHHQRAGLAGSGGFGLYGANDLNYYGSFVDMPGCGQMWRPYLASAAWDPFANGVWAYYPSAGYSWVSPYPWGWLPFHSGSWAQCGAGGWGWRPSGAGWMGLRNGGVMRIAKHPQPHPEPGPPFRGQPTLVPVNAKPLTMSGVNGGAFTFRRDSAGLGVPRTEFGSLRGVSNHVAQHGVATSTAMPYAGPGGPGYVPGAGAAGNRSVTAGVPRGGSPAATTASSSRSSSASPMPSAGPSMSSAPSMSAGGGSHGGGGGSAGHH